MFTRIKTVKSNGKEYKYYQLVESYRKHGTPRQKVILTLGRVEAFNRAKVDDIVSALQEYTDQMVVLESIEDCHHKWARNYGDLFVMDKLWQELQLGQIFAGLLADHEYEFDVTAALKAMVFNRAIDAQSKLSTYEWMKEEVYYPAGEHLKLHHLYRALDFLIAHKQAVETTLYNNLVNLFTVDVSVVFYDCSLVDMYGERSDLVQYSRNGARQFLVCLVLSRDGLPLSYEILPGNTPDIDTVTAAMEQLKERFAIGQCIFVGDRGMVSKEKLEQLGGLGYQYIVGVRLNQWKEVKEEVLPTPGRYSQVTENLQVKEVSLGKKRYLICYNPRQAERDKQTREAVVQALEAEIDGLDPESKKAAALYGHQYKGRFLRKLTDGTLKMDRSQIREDTRYDGKYILLTSEQTLSKEEIATTYKRLSRIERSFRSLKSLHDLNPVYHSADRRIKAHVSVCILAHLLERVMEQKLEQAGLEITASKALRRLGRMQAIQTRIKENEYLIRTDSTAEINEIFQALHYRPPSRVTILAEDS